MDHNFLSEKLGVNFKQGSFRQPILSIETKISDLGQ